MVCVTRLCEEKQELYKGLPKPPSWPNTKHLRNVGDQNRINWISLVLTGFDAQCCTCHDKLFLEQAAASPCSPISGVMQGQKMDL